MKFGRINFTHDPVPHQGVCFIAAAAIGAVGSLAGSAITSNASKKASQAQADAIRSGIGAQREMFDIARGEQQPFIDAGQGILPILQKFINPNENSSPLSTLLKLTTPGASMTETLEATPGFQFTSEYGQKAARNALAARGLAGPGGALSRGIADYTTGLASNTWQNVVQALLGTYNAGVAPMQNLAALGGNSANALSSAATQTGSGIANSFTNLGNAQSSGILGSANALAGGATNTANAFSNQMILQNLLKGNQNGAAGGGLYQTAAGPSSLTGWYNQ